MNCKKLSLLKLFGTIGLLLCVCAVSTSGPADGLGADVAQSIPQIAEKSKGDLSEVVTVLKSIDQKVTPAKPRIINENGLYYLLSILTAALVALAATVYAQAGSRLGELVRHDDWALARFRDMVTQDYPLQQIIQQAMTLNDEAWYEFRARFVAARKSEGTSFPKGDPSHDIDKARMRIRLRPLHEALRRSTRQVLLWAAIPVIIAVGLVPFSPAFTRDLCYALAAVILWLGMFAWSVIQIIGCLQKVTLLQRDSLDE